MEPAKKPAWRVIAGGRNYVGTGREVQAKCENVVCEVCAGSGSDVSGAQCFLCEGKGSFRDLLPARIASWSKGYWVPKETQKTEMQGG